MKNNNQNSKETNVFHKFVFFFNMLKYYPDPDNTSNDQIKFDIRNSPLFTLIRSFDSIAEFTRRFREAGVSSVGSANKLQA